MQDTPPWEDLPLPDTEPVTQDQQTALLSLIQGLKDHLIRLDIRVTQLEAGTPTKAKVDNSVGEKLSSGKHAGKTRDWVVENAPDYVCYLEDNGWATDRWGFSAVQIAAARSNPLLQSLQRPRR